MYCLNCLESIDRDFNLLYHVFIQDKLCYACYQKFKAKRIIRKTNLLSYHYLALMNDELQKIVKAYYFNHDERYYHILKKYLKPYYGYYYLALDDDYLTNLLLTNLKARPYKNQRGVKILLFSIIQKRPEEIKKLVERLESKQNKIFYLTFY